MQGLRFEQCNEKMSARLHLSVNEVRVKPGRSWNTETREGLEQEHSGRSQAWFVDCILDGIQDWIAYKTPENGLGLQECA